MASKTQSIWKQCKLSDLLSEFKNGCTAVQNKNGVGLPVTRIETIASGQINYDRVGFVDVSEDSVESYRLRKGDILLSHINSVPHIGKVASYDGRQVLFHGMNLMLLRWDAGQVDHSFGYHLLSSKESKKFFEQRCQKAVSQASLNRTEIGSLNVSLPPLPEQRKIAAILSAVDAVIERTQAVIDQLQQVKKALMQELLTRGIPGRHTRFKKTEIGEVPEGWEVAQLRSIARVVRGSTPRPARDPRYFNGNAVPWITVSELSNDEYPYLSSTTTKLTEEGANHSRKLKAGTVVLSNSGYGLGIPKILQISGCANDGIAAFEDLAEIIQPLFLYYWLVSRTTYLRTTVARGVEQPNLNTDLIGDLLVPIPSLIEQEKIVSSFMAVDVRYRADKHNLVMLGSLKSALMSVLLSGEVRVKVEEGVA